MTFSLTQDACELSFSAPFSDWSGNVTSGNDVTLAGSGGGEDLTCTGTTSDTTMNVSCEPLSCDIMFSKQ